MHRKYGRAMGEQLPAVVISADRSSAVRRAIEADGLMLVSKPVRTADLVSAVEALVRIAKARAWQPTAWPDRFPGAGCRGTIRGQRCGHRR